MSKNIFIVGGAGYVGSVLVPKLLDNDHHVTVVDWMIFGQNSLKKHENLKVIRGDLNDYKLIECILNKSRPDIVMNLAVVTDDTGRPDLEKIRKSTNIDGCLHLAKKSKNNGVRLFVYASSSSVYGNMNTSMPVHEDSSVAPLSDYATFKFICEQRLNELNDASFGVCCVRASTVFGISPRQRFDLLINNMTMTSCINNKMVLAGPDYIRPQIHIEDITDFYVKIVDAPTHLVSGEIYNASDNNISIREIGEEVKKALNRYVELEIRKTQDNRSYNVSSLKADDVLGFTPSCTIEKAVKMMSKRIDKGLYASPMSNEIYFNKCKPGYTA